MLEIFKAIPYLCKRKERKQTKLNKKKYKAMTQKEFEARLGKPVETDFYNKVVEPAYMASSYADKDVFVSAWKTPEHEDIIRNLAKVAESNREALSNALKLQDELAYFIADMAHLAFNAIGNGAELRKKAIEVLGKCEYIKYIITKGYELEQYDREDLLRILSK